MVEALLRLCPRPSQSEIVAWSYVLAFQAAPEDLKHPPEAWSYVLAFQAPQLYFTAQV